jgi:hypothetical protein
LIGRASLGGPRSTFPHLRQELWVERQGKTVHAAGKKNEKRFQTGSTRLPQQPLSQDLTGITSAVNNGEDKNIRFGNLIDNPEFIMDDLTVFEVRGFRKLNGRMAALRMF